MNIKAMEQLELIRQSGYCNMFTESTHVLQYASLLGFEELLDYAHVTQWLDILDELSEYKTIIIELEEESRLD